jgi:hypothetical protein
MTDEPDALRIGQAALESYSLYRQYRTNTGKYAAPQWRNGRYDDFRFGVPEEFRLGLAVIAAGLLPKPEAP